jgi:hypothetical protein
VKKTGLLFFLSHFISLAIHSQGEMSAFTSTGRAGVSTTMVRDYQASGINPALLGLFETNADDLSRDKMFSFGLAESAVSANSDALARPELRSNFFSPTVFQGAPQLSAQEKLDAAAQFASAGFALNADVLLMGFAFQPQKNIGGFSLSVKDRFSSSAKFNETGAGIMFRGYNYSEYFDSLSINGSDTTGFSSQPKNFSELFSGTRIQLNWFREFNFSYGRYVLNGDKMKLYGGVGFKFMMGVGFLDMDVNNGFKAVSAMGPVFHIDYGSMSTPSSVSGGGLTSVGRGFGTDAGLLFTFGYAQEFKIGISIADFGSIRWNGNVYLGNDTTLNNLSDHGFDSYNFISEAQTVVGDSGIFSWAGSTDYAVSLPSKLRIGGSYQVNNYLEVCGDAIIPLNHAAGNFSSGLYALGLDFKLPKFFRFSTGFSLSNDFGFNIPLGIYLRSGRGNYEMGIASRDLITFLTKTTPTLSIAMGLLRFHF